MRQSRRIKVSIGRNKMDSDSNFRFCQPCASLDESALSISGAGFEVCGVCEAWCESVVGMEVMMST